MMIEESARVERLPDQTPPRESQRDQHMHTEESAQIMLHTRRAADPDARAHRIRTQSRGWRWRWWRAGLPDRSRERLQHHLRERASAPRRCCRTARQERRERAANQSVASAQRHSPSSASITHTRCSGASCPSASVSFSAAATLWIFFSSSQLPWTPH